MAYKNLSTEAMLQISGAWIDPHGARKQLESIPAASGLVPEIDAAHAGLLAAGTTTADPVAAAAMAENRAQAEAADALHDRKARGFYMLLTARGALADDPKVAAAAIDLRDRLLPQGPAVTQLSYTDEAGNTDVVRERLDAPTVAALKKVRTVGTATLADEVTAWVDAGAELGQLEAERVRLEQDQGVTPTPGGVLAARNHWVNVANALTHVLSLAAPEQKAAVKTVLARLKVEEAKADRRGAAKKEQAKAKEAEGAPAEPEPAETEAEPAETEAEPAKDEKAAAK